MANKSLKTVEKIELSVSIPMRLYTLLMTRLGESGMNRQQFLTSVLAKGCDIDPATVGVKGTLIRRRAARETAHA